MTGAALADLIGRIGILTVQEHTGFLRVPVVVTDARGAYGKVRLRVRPHVQVKGQDYGSAWVGSHRVELATDERVPKL